MPELKTLQPQQDLFKDPVSETSAQTDRFPALARSQKPILITTSTEQILLAAIVMVLFFCVVFFLGMLRGRSVSQKAAEGQVRTVQTRPTAGVTEPAQDYTPSRPITAAQVIARPTASVSQPMPPQPVIDRGSITPVKNAAKPYTVQLVTHRSKDQAENELRQLRRMGYNGFIIPSGEFFQVCVGQYANSAEAKKNLAFFKSRHRDCYIRRY